jgi:ankyrin repeat protein
LEIIKYLVEKNINIRSNNDEALIISARNGHLEVVKYLIEEGSDIHAKNNRALCWSANNGYVEVVKYLVEQGADINVNNGEALRLSVYHGHLEVVKYLIENGANIHVFNDYILKLSAKKYLEIIRYLIIDCNMTIKKETLQDLQEKNLTDTLHIINTRDLQQKLDNSLINDIENKKILKVKI